jgi:hypothetical protein
MSSTTMNFKKTRLYDALKANRTAVERSVISEILSYPGAVYMAMDYLNEANFSDEKNIRLFSACKALASNGYPVAFTTVQRKMAEMGFPITNVDYVRYCLPSDTPGFLTQWCLLLVEYSIREHVAQLLLQEQANTATPLADAIEVISSPVADVFQAIAGITAELARLGETEIKDKLMAATEATTARAEQMKLEVGTTTIVQALKYLMRWNGPRLLQLLEKNSTSENFKTYHQAIKNLV